MTKRKRIARPGTLVVFGIFFLSVPFLDYFVLAWQMKISYSKFYLIFRELNIVALALLFMPFLVGIGLLMVKRWGWWLFLCYSVLLTGYNIFSLVKSFGGYNLFALVESGLVSFAVFYFSRKDISAPYFKLYPRGWRWEKRRPIEIQTIIDGIKRETKDFSPAGFYVNWENCDKKINSEVDAEFEIENVLFRLKCGMVRIDEGGAGLAFRDISGSERESLTGFVDKYEKENSESLIGEFLGYIKKRVKNGIA